MYQIYAAHQSARPKAENPAWQNSHMDFGRVLEKLSMAYETLRLIEGMRGGQPAISCALAKNAIHVLEEA